MKTPITEMFDIEFPIVAFSHCRDVIAAVSRAGGMGVLGAVAHSDEALETDLAWIEDEIGDRPYGVDLIVPARYSGSEEGGLQVADLLAAVPGIHQDFLDELLERYGVPENRRRRVGASPWHTVHRSSSTHSDRHRQRCWNGAGRPA
jgi:NAD(P)H-dependent flavin oxidoreductase YrpB (nitropropane dioxygenase family)